MREHGNLPAAPTPRARSFPGDGMGEPAPGGGSPATGYRCPSSSPCSSRCPGRIGAATYLGLPHPELPAPLAALVDGIAIVGAAFVLSWAAEAAQVDISAGLALA
ncbi:MAG TPA: hypothetical protein VNO83_01425, partial [Pseudonocardia sp.]|nr:hypothetical protein [Pseudonocardia sp.]